MIKTNKRAALTVAAVFMGIASPAGASVVNGQVTFNETRCVGDCTGQAVNPFLDTVSIGTFTTDITGPMSLGAGASIEAHYLGGNSFGFDVDTLINPSLGGIVSGIDFSVDGTTINGTTISFDGELENATLFTAFSADSIAVFIEKTSTSGSLLEEGRITVDLALNIPTDDPIEVVPDNPTSTPISSVPVPAGLPMLLAGLAGLGLFARRKS